MLDARCPSFIPPTPSKYTSVLLGELHGSHGGVSRSLGGRESNYIFCCSEHEKNIQGTSAFPEDVGGVVRLSKWCL